MVNFMLTRLWECPDIWANIIRGVSVRVFLDETLLEVVDWAKQIVFPNVGGPHPTRWRNELNKKAEWEAFHLPDYLNWDISLTRTLTRTYPTGSPGCPSCWLQILVLLCSLHKSHEPIFYYVINRYYKELAHVVYGGYIYVYISYWLCMPKVVFLVCLGFLMHSGAAVHKFLERVF